MEPIDTETLLQAAQNLFDPTNPPEPLIPPQDTSISPQYPEVLLQTTKHGNRDYNAFQQYDKQFVTEPGLQIMRWDSKSRIYQRLSLVVNAWIVAEGRSNNLAKLSDKQRENAGFNGSQQRERISAANALFTWSSSEAYVREKRRQLNERKAKDAKRGPSNGLLLLQANTVTTTVADTTKIETSSKDDATKGVIALETTSKSPTPQKIVEPMMAKLNRVIEIESNRFVHLRIAEIKEHHNQEIHKQISDRKRRDHEDYLHRIKLKEEEYDRRMQSIGAPKQGFFNTLFGLQNKELEYKGGKVEKVEKSDKIDKKRFLFLPVRKDKDKEGLFEPQNETQTEMEGPDPMVNKFNSIHTDGSTTDLKPEEGLMSQSRSVGINDQIDTHQEPELRTKRNVFQQVEGISGSNSPSTPISQTFSSGILTPKKKDSPMKMEIPKRTDDTTNSNVADIVADILEPKKPIQRGNGQHGAVNDSQHLKSAFMPLESLKERKKDDQSDDFGDFSSFEPVATTSPKRNHRFIPLQDKSLIDMDESNANDIDLLLI